MNVDRNPFPPLYSTSSIEDEPKVHSVPWTTGIIGAITLGVLVFFFLTTFFFLYVSRVEKSIFENEVTSVLDELQQVSDSAHSMSSLPAQTIRPDQLVVDGDAIQKWREGNESVKRRATTLCLYVLAGLVVVTLVAAYLLPAGQRLSILGGVWLRALVYLTFIGLIEWLFLTIVTSQFKIISVVQIKQDLMKKVADAVIVQPEPYFT